MSEKKRLVILASELGVVAKTGTSTPPTSDDRYVFNERLVNTEPGHSKEYNIRIYPIEGLFELWAFFGRIGGHLQNDHKGSFEDQGDAVAAAQKLLYAKRSGRGYKPAQTQDFDGVNYDIPGVPDKS